MSRDPILITGASKRIGLHLARTFLGNGAEYRENALKKSLVEREDGLEEFQRTVDYLPDNHCVTGRVLPLDGGRHLRS